MTMMTARPADQPSGICPKCKRPFDDHEAWLELGPERLLCPART